MVILNILEHHFFYYWVIANGAVLYVQMAATIVPLSTKVASVDLGRDTKLEGLVAHNQFVLI